MGMIVPRGSLVCGRKQLAAQFHIGERSVRTMLTRLKSTNDLTIKTTNRFSIISIVNYNLYQENTTTRLTNVASGDRPTTDQQPTTSKECKNEKNEKNTTLVEREPSKPRSFEEVKLYFKILEAPLDAEYFFDHFESNGWKVGGKTPMRNWKAAARNWLRSPYRNKNQNANFTKTQERNIQKIKTFQERIKNETRDTIQGAIAFNGGVSGL